MTSLRSKMMMMILACLCGLVCAQTPNSERRVYYLDITHSMIDPNDIWDDVRENLTKAINAVEDETTELVVVCFTDENHQLKTCTAMANEKGKKKLTDFVKNLKTVTNCHTNQSVCFRDFYNRATKKRNYMFLMTDGACHSGFVNSFESEVKKWNGKYADKSTYGFYVKLCKEATSPVDAVIEKQKNMWIVESADININIIRIDNAVLNIRNDKDLRMPIIGKCSGVDFDVTLDDKDYELDDYSLKNGQLVVEVKPLKDTSVLPAEKTVKLQIKATSIPKFSYFVSPLVNVRILNKKENALKVSIR